MKTTVIYHSADFDGLFCREIAKKFLPDAELIGWDYGNPKLSFPDDGLVYILDLSPECFNLTKDNLTMRADGGFDGNGHRTIWIDHHKSAIDKFPTHTPGLRLDGVAACRLAWQWFYETVTKGLTQFAHTSWTGASKDNFINRTVSEPYAVQLAGEYDIWDKRNPDAEVFQLGLRSRELEADDWKWLLTIRDPNTQGEYELGKTNWIIHELLRNGQLLQSYQRQQDTFAMKNSFLVEFEGLKFLALNTTAKSSLAFASKDVSETGHDALFKFNWNGSIWDVSMYHAKHNTGIDLSKIAVKYGGGGHRGACGFRATKLPFIS